LQRCPTAKCECLDERGENFIDRPVDTRVEFLLSGQSLYAGCRLNDNDRPMVFVDERAYLRGLPILSRFDSQSAKAASIIARFGRIHA